MQPNLEVLPPEKPRLMLSGKKREGWIPAGETPDVLSVIKKKAGSKSKYSSEIRLQAYTMYRDMGEARSCAKVAAALNLTTRRVQVWSFKEKWQKQISLSGTVGPTSEGGVWEAKQRAIDRVFVERANRLIDFQLTDMEKDLSLPPEELVKAKTSLNKLKELFNVFLLKKKAMNEDVGIERNRQEFESPDAGGNGKGPKGGVMVNVIFRG